MKSLILTFDYELFFNKSGTPECSIIEPTKKIIKILEGVNGKAVFFIDALYLLTLKRSKDISDINTFSVIEEQLIYLVSKGHRIELHLHPHWIDAYKNGDEWIFPTYEHYKLSSLSNQMVMNLFDDSVELLTSIAQNVIPDYKVAAFRAGGWCVEPFDCIRQAFQKHNIKIDSSIAPGMAMSGGVHQLDYTDLSASSHYLFSDDIRVNDFLGEYIEVPVNGYYLSCVEKIYLFFANKINRNDARIFGDGKGIEIIKHRSKFLVLVNLLLKGKQFSQFSLDGYIDPVIFEKKIQNSELQFICVVAHPKLLTDSSLKTISHLGKSGCRFLTFQDLYKNIL